MQRTCRNPWCKQPFEITEEDSAFYEKVSPVFNGKKELIPPPTLCPECRQQRRLSFRNERKLYHRTCDMTGKPVLSIYTPDAPYKVYDRDAWWGDRWDALAYGREYDSSKTMGEQIKALYADVPHVALYNTNIENSSYTNYALNQRNCYLIFGAGDNEDCLYGKFVVYCKDCVDCLTVYSCELCYEGTASEQCYDCRFFVNCRDCSNCTMIEDCLGCKDCIGCFGLQAKQHYIFNTAYSAEAYARLSQEFSPLSHSNIERLQQRLSELKQSLPHRHAHIYASENCTGESVYHSKNCLSAFDCKNCEDCRYIYFSPKTLCTQDCTFCAPDGDRYCYNVCSTVDLESSMACFYVWYGSNVYYSLECHHNNNIFGCVGLRNKHYCILNKQYTKEEYEKMAAKIVEFMRANGEWGEYLPIDISPFAYNETIAQEYFPLTKESVQSKNGRWHDEVEKKPSAKKNIPGTKLPESIMPVTDDILNWAIECEATKRPFRIIKQELDFYRKMKLPIPRFHPDERHRRRMALKNPYRLWQRPCMKCGKEMETTYAPERPEIVYCENCYLKEVY
ncbi:MAG: hypothetical protein V1876_00295 [Candidatus Peregrinibacteria bacterium]